MESDDQSEWIDSLPVKIEITKTRLGLWIQSDSLVSLSESGFEYLDYDFLEFYI